ncbi:MAG: hypothetical protein ACFCUU_02945 [Cyclobacteriaceae bacterium]
MNLQVVKQSIHHLIDQIDDNDFLLLCQQLLERELAKNASTDYSIRSSEDELISRAKASLKSIEKGNTRNLEEFKRDIEKWKEKRAI